jgi:hypothetical protein
MGLDMYIQKRVLSSEDIVTFRKEHALHEAFRRLGCSKKIKGCETKDDFNCVEIPLTEEDILEIIKIVKKANYHNQSTYFGDEKMFASEEEEETVKEYLLENLSEALKSIIKGDEVFYTSWW